MAGIPYESALNFGFDPISGLWQPIYATQIAGKWALDVNDLGGGGSGGTSAVDESAFTAGTSVGTPIMGEDGTELLILACDASRNLKVNIAAGSITVAPVTSNTVSNAGQQTVGTSSASLLAANPSRTRFIVQNDGTTRIFILFGSGTASATNYSICLPACGSAHDGSSAPYIDTQWI